MDRPTSIRARLARATAQASHPRSSNPSGATTTQAAPATTCAIGSRPTLRRRLPSAVSWPPCSPGVTQMPRPRDVRGRPPGGSRPDVDAPASAADQPPAEGSSSALRVTPGRAAEPYRIIDLPESIAGRITIHPASGCWIVGGTPSRDGHARIGGRSAARVIWELLVGPVPGGLVVDHREDWGCLSKACGWPAHLLPVTPFVNSTRPGAGGVAAINIRKDRCGRCGTPFDLLNTYFRPRGGRDCRVCTARRQREYKARLRAPQATPGTPRHGDFPIAVSSGCEGRRAA